MPAAFTYLSADGTPITAHRWDPEGPPPAIVQISHGFDWLSRDDAIVDAYIADPICGFGIDTASARQMFAGARRFADPAAVAAIRPDLPVYIAAGEMDPVDGGLTLLTPLAERLTAAGLTDVTVVTYPDARHEILNETNRDEVIAATLGWIGRVTS